MNNKVESKPSKKIVAEWSQDPNKNLKKIESLQADPDFPSISIPATNQSFKRTKGVSYEERVSISEIKSLVRNPKQFMWVFGVELGYHIPPRAYITWPYIMAILTGKRSLLKSSSIS